MFKLASYVSILMGVLLIFVLGAWTLVMLQINLYLLPQPIGVGEIHPLYSFPDPMYAFVWIGLLVQAGIFLTLGVLMRDVEVTPLAERDLLL